MTDYEVGYGKPPVSRRFQPGVSGNPRGRPKRAMGPWAETIQALLDEPVKYRVGGRIRRATYLELAMKTLVEQAAKGDVAAASLVLRMVGRMERFGDAGVRMLLIENWMPAFPGQTAQEKARELVGAQAAAPGETGASRGSPLGDG